MKIELNAVTGVVACGLLCLRIATWKPAVGRSFGYPCQYLEGATVIVFIDGFGCNMYFGSIRYL